MKYIKKYLSQQNFIVWINIIFADINTISKF